MEDYDDLRTDLTLGIDSLKASTSTEFLKNPKLTNQEN